MKHMHQGVERSVEKDVIHERQASSRGKRRVNYKEHDNEGDDEDFEWRDEPSPKKRKSTNDHDDPPLSALKAKKKTVTNGDTKKKKFNSSPSKDKTKENKKIDSKPDKVESNVKANNENYQSASAALYGSGCEKGLLIQRLLCRWWYAMDWPDPKILSKQPPHHYDSLEGYPGVFVCTSGDKVGHILDTRDMDCAPNFINMSKMSSEKLQELLIKALEAQKMQLIAVEGQGSGTEKELDDLIKWAKRIKPASADAAAKKVLKAAKFSTT
jgi:hypothetical protein